MIFLQRWDRSTQPDLLTVVIVDSRSTLRHKSKEEETCCVTWRRNGGGGRGGVTGDGGGRVGLKKGSSQISSPNIIWMRWYKKNRIKLYTGRVGRLLPPAAFRCLSLPSTDLSSGGREEVVRRNSEIERMQGHKEGCTSSLRSRLMLSGGGTRWLLSRKNTHKDFHQSRVFLTYHRENQIKR